jgi:hypothetical protein
MVFLKKMEKTPTLLFLGATLTIATFVVIVNSAFAQETQTTAEPFVVISAIQGIDSKTGYILNWATANNITVPRLYNASTVDLEDEAKDGIVEIPITFPNSTVSTGDKFSACALVLKDKSMTCQEGFDSPSSRAEFVSFLVSLDKKEQ